MWMKVDDKLHAHRKTRRVVTTADEKRRDAAPMGLWVLAGSWAGQNTTNGWIPEHELDRWDDDWEPLASRLVKAGFWWPEQRDGEPGYGFVDWDEYNPSAGSSEAGVFGNHKRWHVDRKIVDPECPHCPTPPPDLDEPDYESAPDIGGRSGGDIGGESRNVALPDPTRPEPDPKNPSSTKVDGRTDRDRFDEFWDTYAKKVGRKAAQQKWKLALKKKGVTADSLIEAARRYIEHQKWEGKHPDYTKNPATWLNGEHWDDEIPTAPMLRAVGFNAPTVDQFGYRDE